MFSRVSPRVLLTRIAFCVVFWVVAFALDAGQALRAGAQIADPFHNAIRLQDFTEARRLLDKSGRSLLTEIDSYGMLPLHSAASAGSLEAVEFLLDEGVDAGYRPEGGYSAQIRGRSPLHLAARDGRVDVVELLSESQGVDLEGGDADALTPLSIAVTNGHLRILAQLLRQGAEIDTRAKAGNTPLHYATRTGKKEIVEALLKAGADGAARNGKNETAHDIARELGHEQILAILR